MWPTLAQKSRRENTNSFPPLLLASLIIYHMFGKDQSLQKNATKNAQIHCLNHACIHELSICSKSHTFAEYSPWVNNSPRLWRKAVNPQIGPGLLVADGDGEPSVVCPRHPDHFPLGMIVALEVEVVAVARESCQLAANGHIWKRKGDLLKVDALYRAWICY